MKARLYLRRVMCNSTAPGTVSLTDEEKRRTIISLQGGKTFGRASKNDVVFVDGAEGAAEDSLKSPQFISRSHACVEHTTDGDDRFEQFFLYDTSENGTYVNDKKLEKNKPFPLSSGQSIKFGHRNGSQHVAGEQHEQPNAQFAFIVEMSSYRESLYDELPERGEKKVQVFSESACTREVTGELVTREGSPVNGGCPENGIPSSSTASAANGSTIPGQMPSTSRTLNISNIPERAPHDSKFTDPLNCYVINANRHNYKYQDAVTAQSLRFQIKHPPLRPLNDALASFLDIHVAYEDMKTKKQKIEVIDNFCTTNEKRHRDIKFLHEQKYALADLLVEDEPETDKIRELLVKLSTKPIDPIPSEMSAFAVTHPQPGEIYRPIAIYPENSETDYVNYLRFIDLPPDKAVAMARLRTELRRAAIAMKMDIPLSDMILNALHIARYRNVLAYPSPAYFWGNYLYPFRQLEMCPIATSVITQAPRIVEVQLLPVGGAEAPLVETPESVQVPRPPQEAMDTGDVDEERHSASSGSTTDNSFRQRTESVESEIVDVVTTDDDKPAQDEKGGTETETPTPSPQDSGAALEEDPRKSSTPRIDAQGTPSAVVSALPTPMSSPVPKVSKAQKTSAAPEPISPEVTAPIHVDTTSKVATPAAVTPVTSSPAIPPPKASVKASGITPKIPRKAPPSPDSDEPSTSSKPTEEATKKNLKPSTSMPSTSDATAANKTKQKEAAAPSRKMKQLDESSADSESEDDDKSKKQKKVRRSTRTAKASSPVPSKRKKPTEEDMEEGSEDVQDESKTTPTRGGAVRRKNLKRPHADAAAEPKPPRRSTKDNKEKDGDEEPPKKKRGRKKAEPAAVEDEEPADPDKEKCGVAGTYCLCIKYEKRKNLQWVSCSDCNQWFHVWCVRLDNVGYGADDKFACCGPHASPEAVECLQGDVHRKWWAIPGKRPVPQSPEQE